MATESVFVELRATITEFKAKMAEARGEMAKTAEEGSSKFDLLSKAGGALTGGAAAASVAVAGLAVKMGNELEDARAKLEAALKASGSSFDQVQGPIASADKAMERFGFTNAQTEEALASGVVATGSASKALSLMQAAAEVATYKHVDLATAMVAVSKGAEGNMKPLKQMGIDLPVVASSAEKVKLAQEAVAKAQANANAVLAQFPNAADKASKAHAQYEKALASVQTAQQKLQDVQSAGGQIVDAITQRLGGQASAAADTFSGKIAAARARTSDMLAELGLKLIPVIERSVEVISGVVDWLERHRTVAIALGAVIGGVLLTAVTAYAASLAVAAAEQLLAAAGVLLVLAPLILLGAAIYELATHWKEVWGFMKAVVTDAWHWIDSTFVHPIMGFFSTVADFIRGHWQLIVGILTGPIGLVVTFISQHVDQIVGFITDLPGRIASVAVHMWDSIVDGFKAAIDGIIWIWNEIAQLTDLRFPGINLGPIHIPSHDFGQILPSIPYLEQGGLVTKTGLIYAHAGEAVSPLPKTGGTGPLGDIVIQVDGQEFGRIAGPHVRKWFEQGPGRNAVRGRLT